MSWYVKTLLVNREKIRTSTVKRLNRYSDRVYVDLTDNDFNNLLILEKMIKTLHKSGNIADKELELINLVSTNKSFRDLEKEGDVARHSLSKRFDNVCEKLAYILGGEFTDEGYLNYIGRKYNLNSEQIEQAREYMIQTNPIQI